MTVTTRGAAALLLFAFMCTAVFAQDDKPEKEKKSSLRRGTIKILDEEVIPAALSGNDAYFLQVMSPIIQKANANQLADIEIHCQNAGIDSVQTRFADIVLEQVEQGGIDIVQKVDSSIALYLAEELSRKVDKLLEEVKAHAVSQNPLTVSDDWQVSEQLFWEIHVFNNECLNARSLVGFGVEILKPHVRSLQKSKSPEGLAILKKVEDLVADLPATHRDMMERDAEMRWLRFAASHERLLKPGDFETLLTSAMCVELDAEKLTELFAQLAPGNFSRQVLNDPDLPAKIDEMVESARQVGDQIAYKAILFRSGLHFWLRGRYGAGPLANGLLKSPEAMNSIDAMVGLYMPKERPTAINEYTEEEEPLPGYGRRHYYTWAVEYRPLLKEVGSESRNESSRVTTGAKATGRFW